MDSPHSSPVPGSGAVDPAELGQRLGVVVSPDVLRLAMTHRSYAFENGGLLPNERLEFLGDSVLGLVITDGLYRTHPGLPEGQLAKLRSAVVNARALADVARGLDLGRYLLLGKGEEATHGREKTSILADAMEAVIGAVYVDRGLDEATRLIQRLFEPLLADAAQLGAALDWKTSMQEISSRLNLGVPDYRIQESGPDHDKHFVATVHLGERAYGSGSGPTKKAAEQAAAAATYAQLTETGRSSGEGPPTR